MMVSVLKLDSLPVELILEISDYLTLDETATLASCNLYLMNCLHSKLWQTEASKNDIMVWACKSNNLILIKCAALNGANVSIVDFRSAPYPSPGRTIRGYTLYLAVTFVHLEAFKLLLELGARVDDPNVDKQLHDIMRNKCSFPCETWDFLPVCLDKGLDVEARQTIGLPSIPILVHSRASIKLIEMLLDKGADPNETHSTGSFRLANALSEALMQNEMALARLLHVRGASIHGIHAWHPSWNALHIPVMAAAKAIVKHGFGPMQFCLDNGANVNQFVWVFTYGGRLYQGRRTCSGSAGNHYLSTPLLTYLISIHSWDEPSHVHPINGIKFLLDRGARICCEYEIPSVDQAGHTAMSQLRPAPTCLDVLFDKCKVSQLAVPTFFETVKFLVTQETSCKRLAKVLSKCDYHCDVEDGDTLSFVPAWKGILTVACESAALNTDLLLAYYILYGGLEVDEDKDPFLAYLTIDHLLAAGGDINARTEPGGATGLHLLCKRYARYSVDHEEEIKDYLTFLMHRGINPSIPLGHQTAIDIVLDARESSQKCKFLTGIGEVLKRYMIYFPQK